MVADAGPSIAVVLSEVKWFTASVVVLWQFVQVLWSELIPCWPEL
jgi:hypothetical protein